MSQRTLVLNATYQPLAVVPLRRAVILVLAEKAEVVEEGGVLHSSSMDMPAPSVIRLTRFVRVPYRRRVPVSRKSVLARDNHVCGYCGARATTIDHVKPRSKGGKHVWTNVVAACLGCNGRKADRTPEEAGMPLRLPLFEPAGTVAISVVVGRLDETWLPYLELAA